jgi:hypothetical protein
MAANAFSRGVWHGDKGEIFHEWVMIHENISVIQMTY